MPRPAKKSSVIASNAVRRPSKYRNVPTVVDGIKFASKREAARYGELKLLVAADQISWLQCQVPYPIDVGGNRICRYVADFVYCENGAIVVEDVKSPASITPVYKLKRKLMKALYNIEIRETK